MPNIKKRDIDKYQIIESYNELISNFKIIQISLVLNNALELVKNKLTTKQLSLIENDTKNVRSNNNKHHSSNICSDVVIIISQFKSTLKEYKDLYVPVFSFK